MSNPRAFGDLMPTTLSQTSKLNLPSVSSHVTQQVQKTIQTYQSEQRFLSIFNPQKQVQCTKNNVRVFRGTAPSLTILAEAFGVIARNNWLDIQLTELAVFSGSREKLNDLQIEELVKLIASEYGYLKVTELMCFFREFKTGHYGKFYGAVDPLAITTALREFCVERRQILNRIEKAERIEREKNDPEHVHYVRQYNEYRRMATFYSWNFRSADFTLEDFSEIWWLFNLGYERSNHGYFY